MDATGSQSCPMVRFGIGDFEPLEFTTTVLIYSLSVNLSPLKIFQFLQYRSTRHKIVQKFGTVVLVLNKSKK
jgi:hypothetical protein